MMASPTIASNRITAKKPTMYSSKIMAIKPRGLDPDVVLGQRELQRSVPALVYPPGHRLLVAGGWRA
jgi:hypothetical protein